MTPWQIDWRIEVLLGKVVWHDCKNCYTKTVHHLSVVLDDETKWKHYKWKCSECANIIWQDLGPFVPN